MPICLRLIRYLNAKATNRVNSAVALVLIESEGQPLTANNLSQTIDISLPLVESVNATLARLDAVPEGEPTGLLFFLSFIVESLLI